MTEPGLGPHALTREIPTLTTPWCPWERITNAATALCRIQRYVLRRRGGIGRDFRRHGGAHIAQRSGRF